jgi:cystathionine beta-lyase
MKKYDFDKEINRRGSGALKYDALETRYGDANLYPLWVADMDFEVPDFITDVLKERMEHPSFGYTIEPKDYRPAIIDWIKARHGWDIRPEWLSYIPGIVKGIGFVINVFVKDDEKVIVHPPVYHPFRLTAIGNKREVVYNPLKQTSDGSYEIDFEHLASVVDDKCRLLILANPHNPAGLLWPKETLQRLAHFCKEHNILVISDEIHCDMPLWGAKHQPFATVSPEAAEISITFGAPSKVFNIPGLVSSYAIVPNEKIRARFFGWLSANELNEADIFAPIATIAAYRRGEEWRQQMVHYIEQNILFLEDYCKQYIPEIVPLRPQASYLVWLNCKALNLPHKELNKLFVEDAHLALNDGEMFGKEGAGYMRMNIGLPRKKLEQALESLRSAIVTLRESRR